MRASHSFSWRTRYDARAFAAFPVALYSFRDRVGGCGVRFHSKIAAQGTNFELHLVQQRNRSISDTNRRQARALHCLTLLNTSKTLEHCGCPILLSRVSREGGPDAGALSSSLAFGERVG